jgi:outer membrane protein
MKKLILSIAVLAGLGISAQAQTEKGKIILGGSVAYQSEKSDANGANAAESFNVLPSVGYFIADNIAIGTSIGYNYSNVGTASATGQREEFLVSPFGRYYTALGEKFKFFGQLQVPLAFGNVKDTDASGDAGSKTGTSTSIGVALSPGFAYFPTKKIGIEFALNGISYNNYRVEDANGNELKGAGSDSFAIGTNFFAPRIGIQFHF